MRLALLAALFYTLAGVVSAAAMPDDHRSAEIGKRLFCDTLAQMQKLLAGMSSSKNAAAIAASKVNAAEKTTVCGMPKVDLVYHVRERGPIVASVHHLYRIYRVEVIGIRYQGHVMPRPSSLSAKQFMAVYLGRLV